MDWLRIPTEQLEWKDIPHDLRVNGRAIVILALREMPYAEYLLTNHWQETRKQRLEKDRYRCVLCPAPARDVHHLDYSRRGFEEMEDLRSLCRPCHETAHTVNLHQMRAQVRQELEGRN